ncbi:MAG: hypothetical protein K8R87_10805, partial [Verrucomicrobia bacterium]|nr:hypothetical protein [Verrucomicrobiota bacterium]
DGERFECGLNRFHGCLFCYLVGISDLSCRTVLENGRGEIQHGESGMVVGVIFSTPRITNDENKDGKTSL